MKMTQKLKLLLTANKEMGDALEMIAKTLGIQGTSQQIADGVLRLSACYHRMREYADQIKDECYYENKQNPLL